MLARRKPSRYLFLTVFLFFWLIAVYSLRAVLHIPDLEFDSSLAPHWSSPSDTSEDISTVSDLRRLCEDTAWNDGLWIQCHSNGKKDNDGKKSVHGGLNNIRNRVQTCLRVAIDAGAGVIIPSVSTRSPINLKDLRAGTPINASNFWNMEYMRDALATQCPQLQIRFDWKDIETRLDGPSRYYKHARYQKGTFREMTTSILDKAKLNTEQIFPDKPVAISFGDTFLAWDYEKSGELATVRKDLFKTIIYNQTLLDISSQILKSPQLQGGFIGVHLRAETDWPRSFGKAKDQMRLYTKEMEALERTKKSDLRTIYVSCGNQTGIQAFREWVAPLGYTVHDKWSILAQDSETLARVEALLFDEKAVVEYQMLRNANFFVGPVMSSMSSLIAYARALDETATFFPTYIFPGSERDWGEDGLGLRRTYPKVPVMRGDSKSKLMLVNGDDIMSFFP